MHLKCLGKRKNIRPVGYERRSTNSICITQELSLVVYMSRRKDRAREVLWHQKWCLIIMYINRCCSITVHINRCCSYDVLCTYKKAPLPVPQNLSRLCLFSYLYVYMYMCVCVLSKVVGKKEAWFCRLAKFYFYVSSLMYELIFIVQET